MIGLALIGAAGGMTNGVFSVEASQGFGADLRDALFRKVQTLSRLRTWMTWRPGDWSPT
jgi:ATP-binding cassette subfamily B protein